MYIYDTADNVKTVDEEEYKSAIKTQSLKKRKIIKSYNDDNRVPDNPFGKDAILWTCELI
jgi:hypothetical protein